MWPIVTTTLTENRHELVLSGPNITNLLEQSGFDERIYELTKLNFLEISQVGLDALSEKIKNLKCLTQLCLTLNKLTQVPESLGQLQSLKFLDLSFNQLDRLPGSVFSQLENLTSVNLSGNNLETIPPVGKLQALQELIASKNQLKDLPEGIHLLQAVALLDFSHNQISSLPDELENLNNLKTVDFSDNALPVLPTSLHRCRKLHLIRVQNNPIKDSRLRKLANDPKASKPLLDYLRRLDEQAVKSKKGRGKSSQETEATTTVKETDVDRSTDSTNVSPDAVDPANTLTAPPSHPYIIILRPEDNEWYRISQSSCVKDGPRPYLIACTVHGVKFKSDAQLKAFTRAQEDWHREIGQMRRRATLATHDLRMVRFPLVYTLRKSDLIQFQVLNASDATTGDRFLAQLHREAEADRKTRKQAKFTQLYRYLSVLNLEPGDVRDGFRNRMLPVVEDATHTVISVPPLTNSHQTRLTVETTSILIEVSGINLNACKEFAEVVIAWLLEHAVPATNESRIEQVPVGPNELTSPPTDDVVAVTLGTRELSIPPNALVVRPIRVVDSESASKLSSLFPSRLDLVAPKFGTVR